MKKLLFILIAVNCFGQAPSIEWQKSFGGGYYDNVANSIIQTTDGGYIFAGSRSHNVNSTTGSIYHDFDGYIIKVNSIGIIEWEKSLGNIGDDEIYSIQQTLDGGYIAAGYSNILNGSNSTNHGGVDFWIIKINSSGDILWQNLYGGDSNDVAYTIKQTLDGGYIIGGMSINVPGSHGGFDSVVLKINNLGIIEWQKLLGGNLNEKVNYISQTSDGGYIVANETESNNGDVTGFHVNTYINSDGWIVKLNSIGNIEWEKAIGGSLTDEISCVKQCDDGGYLLVGSTSSLDGDVTNLQGCYDGWMIKLNSFGNIIWQKTFGGTSCDYFSSVEQTIDGGFITTGLSASNDGDVSGNHLVGIDVESIDCWIVKIDKNGILKWQKSIGGSNWDYPRCITNSNDGGFVLSGSTGSLDGDFISNNNLGSFILKLSPEPLSNSTFQKNNLIIFPNPTTNFLNLQLPNEALIDKVTVSDLSGKIILNQIVITNKINTENLAKGLYFIQAFSGDTIYQTKFIKE